MRRWIFRFIKFIWRFKVLIFEVILLLVGSVATILQSPAVQNQLLPLLSNFLSKELGTEVHISKIELELFNRILLSEVRVMGLHQDTILQVETIKLGVFDLPVSQWILGNPGTRKINLTRFELIDADLLLTKLPNGKLNIDFLIQTDSTAPPSNAKYPTEVRLSDLQISGLRFRYSDLSDSTNEPPLVTITNSINYNDLHIFPLNLQADFWLKADKSIELKIVHLDAKEINSGFNISHFKAALNAGFEIQNTTLSIEKKDTIPFISIQQLKLVADKIDLDLDAWLPGSSLKTLFKTNIKKNYHLTLRPSKIDFHSIERLADVVLPVKGPVEIAGSLSGDYNKLMSKELTIKAGNAQEINLTTAAELENFTTPNISMKLGLKNSLIRPAYLKQLLPQIILPNELTAISFLELNGNYSGTAKSYAYKGSIQTPSGRLLPDLKLEIKPNEELVYGGKLVLAAVNLKSLAGIDAVEKINGSFELDGHGSSIEKMQTKAKFSVFDAVIAGYTLDSIAGLVTIDSSVVEGNLLVRDPEGSLRTQLRVSLNPEKPYYSGSGSVSALDLKHYGISSEALKFRSVFQLDLTGLKPDEMNGTIRLTDGRLVNTHTKRDFTIPTFTLTMNSSEKLQKQIKLSSSMADLTLSGTFLFSSLGKVASHYIEEVGLLLETDTAKIEKYYTERMLQPDTLDAVIRLTTKELNPILRYLNIPLYVPGGTKITTELAAGVEARAGISIEADSLRFQNYRLEKLRLVLNGDKNITSTSILDLNDIIAQGTIDIQKLFFNDNFELENLHLEPEWQSRILKLKLSFKQENLRNQIHLATRTSVSKQKLETQFDADHSYLLIRDTVWKFRPKNLVTYHFSPLGIEVQNLGFQNRGKQLLVDGAITNDVTDGLRVILVNMPFDLIDNFLNEPTGLGGNINVQTELRQLLSRPLASVNGQITGFTYNYATFGDLVISSDWSEATEKLNLSLALKNKQETLIALEGHYDASDTSSPLNFSLSAYNLPVKMIEPLMAGEIYNMKGKAMLEDLKITGNISNPVVAGSGRLDDVSFGVKYFRTEYRCDGNIFFSRDLIRIPAMRLQDAQKGTARLDGYIFHTNFRKYRLDLQLTDISNFLVMNTKQTDNDLFYGKAVLLRGRAEIIGPIDNIKIIASAITGTNTQINLPISGYTTGSRLDFVRFKKAQVAENIEASNAISGITLSLTIEATPDANFRIIFNEKTGEIIQANGKGIINMNITPDGEFIMDGLFEILKGEYLFSFENVSSKKFTLRPGGSIAWNGSATDALADLTAVYATYASLTELDTTSKGKTIVEVELSMRGSLLRPEISFGLNLPRIAANESFGVLSRLQSIRSDPQELNRQVFSLLLFNRFAPSAQNYTTGAGSDGSALGSTVSEFLSNQLNSWLGQGLDEKVGISVTTNDFNNVNLAIRARLFSDRITLERNGALINSRSRDMSVGNLNVQFRILPTDSIARVKDSPGNLSLELFNRENLGVANTVMSTNRGIGVFYRKEFEFLPSPFKPKPHLTGPMP